MGMYDYIDGLEVKCPQCGVIIDDFQSRQYADMKHLKFWEADNFYSSCDNCGCRVEYTYNNKLKSKRRIEDYKRVIQKHKTNHCDRCRKKLTYREERNNTCRSCEDKFLEISLCDNCAHDLAIFLKGGK